MSHSEKGKVLGSGRKYLGKEMHVSVGASRLREGKVLQDSPPTCSPCGDDSTLYYCQTCSYHLCNICYQAHKRQKDTSNHEMIYTGNTSDTAKCLQHPAHAGNHYCKPCTAIVCERCIYGKHRSHPYRPIDQCKQDIKNLCLDQAKELRAPYDQIVETTDNIKRKIDDRSMYYQITKSDLNARHSRLTNLLNTIHKENIDIITKEEQDMNGALQDVEKSVSQFRLKCDQTLAPIMSLVYSDDLNSVLQSIQQMQHQTIESYGVTNKLDQLQKNPIVKLSDSTGFLNIISDHTKQYLKVSHEATNLKTQMKLDDNFVMVVAIDFGREYVGYTFSFKSNPMGVIMNNNLGAEVGFQNYKAPSCVLTDSKGRYKAFGYEAVQLYANSVEEDPEKQYELYSNFIEILGNQRRRKGGEEMVSTSGRLFPANKIIAMLLAFLKNHLMEALQQQGSKPDSRTIRWVITLPATSLTMDTDLVRQAATMAGIIDDENSVKLLTVSAPQAASIYCRHDDFRYFTNYDREDPDRRLDLRAGTKYMIVDCGEMGIKSLILFMAAAVVGTPQGDNTGDVFLLYTDVIKDTVGTMSIDSSQRENCLPSATFNFPSGITYDQNSNTVYMVDRGTGVYKFTLDGQSSPELIYQDTSAAPRTLALDTEGHIFITESGNDKITRINIDGSDPVDWVTGVYSSSGILVDTTDRLIVL